MTLLLWIVLFPVGLFFGAISAVLLPGLFLWALAAVFGGTASHIPGAALDVLHDKVAD